MMSASTLSIAAALLLVSSVAEAAKRRFEPTDLELEDPGSLEVDLQAGLVRSAGPTRIVMPDAEIDLAILPNVELNVDFALGVEGPEEGPFSLDHLTAENVWLAAKLGLADFRNEAAGTAWAFGLQLGPKAPLAPGAHGAGYEALFLVGHSVGKNHVGLNLGGFVDPGAEITLRRPIGAELGFDIELALNEHVSLLGGLGGVISVSPDPHQLSGTLGLQWSPTDSLNFSVSGLLGLPPGSDRYGLLFGMAQQFQLWK